jgi:hypothetical protein
MPELMSDGEESMGTQATEPETAMSDSTITMDQIVELLNSPRRRYLLGCMESLHGTEAEWGEVVKYVTEAEAGKDWAEQERKRVQISLHQNHVPKLEAAGVIIERRAGEERYVAKGPHFDVVVRAHKALNEAAANEDGGDGILGRLF